MQKAHGETGCFDEQRDGETSISTGYHVLEFLLWGRDTNRDGPGARPASDFVERAEDPLVARRRRYLELVREFPPERHPERFAAVRAAYERLKDLDARVRHRLFEAGKRDGIEELIEDVACRTPRRRYGLQALLNLQKPPGR